MCAGTTVFTPILQRPTDRVAVVAIGGLGPSGRAVPGPLGVRGDGDQLVPRQGRAGAVAWSVESHRHAGNGRAEAGGPLVRLYPLHGDGRPAVGRLPGRPPAARQIVHRRNP